MDILQRIGKGSSTFLDSRFQYVEIVFQQDDIGRFSRHIHRRIDRDPDIRSMQGGCIVDPIPQIPDHTACLLERQDDPLFLVRFNLSKNIDVRDSLNQSLVTEMHQFRAGQDQRLGQSDMSGNIGGDQGIVTGDHFQFDPETIQFLNSLSHIGFRGIVQDDETDKRHL